MDYHKMEQLERIRLVNYSNNKIKNLNLRFEFLIIYTLKARKSIFSLDKTIDYDRIVLVGYDV